MNGISEKLNYAHTNNFPLQRGTQKIEERKQLKCKNTQHVGRQHTQNTHTHKTIKTTKDKTKRQRKTKQKKKNKQTKDTLHNEVLREKEIAAR